MRIGQFVHAREECEYLAVVLKEAYHRLIESCKFLVRLIASGIMGGAAVENVASTIARLIGRNALTVRETVHAHHERPLAVVLGERGRADLRV